LFWSFWKNFVEVDFELFVSPACSCDIDRPREVPSKGMCSAYGRRPHDTSMLDAENLWGKVML